MPDDNKGGLHTTAGEIRATTKGAARPWRRLPMMEVSRDTLLGDDVTHDQSKHLPRLADVEARLPSPMNQDVKQPKKNRHGPR